MYFELLSEENYNLLVPAVDLVTEEMVIDIDEQLRDGLVEAPFLVVSAVNVVVIDRDAYAQLRELAALLVSAGGKMLFAECSENLKMELQHLGFEVFDSLFEAYEEVESIVLNQDIDEDL